MDNDQFNSLINEIQTLSTNLEKLNNKNSEKEDIFLDNQLELNKKIDALIDYFIPTEQEIEEQKSIEKEQLKKHNEQLELEKQNAIEEKEQQWEYNDKVLQELTLLNENITKVETVSNNTNAYLYILCFGFLLAFFISFIYKTIKKFMY